MPGSNYNVFTGIINGNDKIISNIKISGTRVNNLGMIGNVNSGTIYGLIINNININGYNNVGLFGSVSKGNIYGIRITKEKITGNEHVSGIIGWTDGITKIREIELNEIEIKGTKVVSGVLDYSTEAVVDNILIKSGKIEATGGISSFVSPTASQIYKNSIIENVSIIGTEVITTNKDNNTYHSNKVTINGNAQTNGFDSDYIDDLDYYTSKVETRLNGDQNNTGYYFDYVYSKGGIYLVNKYDKQESDDDTPNDQKTCKVTYGTEQHGCYRYTSGIHDGYKYRSPSSGELDDGNGAACTGTGLSAAFRKKVYYTCN